jgi:hypothetical protein
LWWVLRRGDDTITSEIHVTPGHAVEVAFIPHWNLEQSVRARYDHATPAFEAHARLVAQLQETGWVVAAHLHR